MNKYSDEMIPAIWRSWLMHTGSLSRALEEASQKPCLVSVQREGWLDVWEEEKQFLGENNISPRYWIREVVISTHQPAIVARSVFPETVLQHFPEFLETGANVLGRRLFADETFKRGPIEVMQIDNTHFLWQQLPADVNVERCWARRSLFHSFFGSLLVGEVFLPYVATL